MCCCHVRQDEVHERDRFSDFLLIVLRELLHRLKSLKIILMSAALNVQLFYNYFGGCPVLTGIYSHNQLIVCIGVNDGGVWQVLQ